MDQAHLSHVELMLGSVEATSKAFLDALTDEVCVVDSSGLIVAVNEAWTRFAANAGASDLETGVGQNYLDVSRTAAAAGEQDAAQALEGLTSVLRRQTEQFSMEYECSSGAGGRRWFLLSVTSLAQLPGALISHREVTERRKAQEALRLSGEMQAMSPLFESFFPALVKNVAVALNADHAFLTEFVDPVHGRVQLLTHWTGAGYGDLFAYETAGTPCENVLTGRTAAFPSGVQKVFPDDEWLKDIGAESYIAVPLIGSDGKVLGHLGVINTKPLLDAGFAETTLKVFASRATPELERRKIERRLADQSRLIDSAPDAVLATDENLVLTYWNKAAENLYGWKAGEVLGLDLGDILKTQISEQERAEARHLLRETGELRRELVQLRKDGSEVEIGATSMAYRDPDGRISGYVSINRDITERKRAEQALRQSERTNKAILDAIPDMMFALDGEGRFLSFKPAQSFQPLVPPAAFLGKLVEEVMPAEVAPELMATIRTCIDSGETQTLVYQLSQEGAPRNFEARAVYLGSNEVLVIVREHTETRRGGVPSRALRTAQILRPRRGDKPRILIADEDVHSLRFLRRLLEQSGHEALVTSDPEEAVRLAELEAPDLILLDLSLRGFDSFSEVRAANGSGLIVLTPPEREVEAAQALRAGADDYIKKPISPAELTARIEAVLKRRLLPELPTPTLELGDLAIDSAAHLVTVRGETVTLTPTEYRLLYELAASPGRVLTHGQLLERVWGAGYSEDHELLRSFIRSLRQKLGDDSRDPEFIRSMRGIGYQILPAPVGTA